VRCGAVKNTVIDGLSVLRGNSQGAFLEEGAPVMGPPYSTESSVMREFVFFQHPIFFQQGVLVVL